MDTPKIVVKKTPQDEELFGMLHGSNIGRLLAGYLERLGDALCDMRTTVHDVATPEGQVEAKARRLASEFLEAYLYREIVVRDGKDTKKTNPNPYM